MSEPASNLDPVTLTVIQNGLIQVCNEMDLAFVRAAFSPVISEGMDRSDGIYDATRRLADRPGRARPAGVRRHHAVLDPGRDRPGEEPLQRQDRRRRRVHRQRSLSRRHPSDGCPLREAVLLQGRAVRLARQHRPLAGYRRHGAGRLLGQRHRGRAGRPAPAADQVLQEGRDGPGDPVHPDEQHAHRRPAHRRHQGAGRRAHHRRPAADRADRPLRRRRGRSRRSTRCAIAPSARCAPRSRPFPTASTRAPHRSTATAWSTSRSPSG